MLLKTVSPFCMMHKIELNSVNNGGAWTMSTGAQWETWGLITGKCNICDPVN